jgi:urease gamma subunit
MKLLPREFDKLALVQAGYVAQRRLARGLRLNQVEACALICTVLLEHVRNGESLTTVSEIGCTLLGRRLVLDSVPFIIGEIQLEATFPDGNR